MPIVYYSLMIQSKTASKIQELYFRKYLKSQFDIVDSTHAKQFHALWCILKSHTPTSNYLNDIDASDGVSYCVVRPLLLLGWARVYKRRNHNE